RSGRASGTSGDVTGVGAGAVDRRVRLLRGEYRLCRLNRTAYGAFFVAWRASQRVVRERSVGRVVGTGCRQHWATGISAAATACGHCDFADWRTVFPGVALATSGSFLKRGAACVYG